MEAIIDIQNNKLVYNNKQVFTIFDSENNPWFKAKDICDILEYSNSRKALSDNVRGNYIKKYEELKCNSQLHLHSDTNFINEPGLFALIMKSKMKQAEQFQDWVCEKVLPSIRKYGEYKLQKEINIQNKRMQYLEDKLESTFRSLDRFSDLAMDHIHLQQDIIKKHATPPTINREKHNEFILIKKKHMWEYPYYVIRTQNNSVSSRLNKLEEDYPEMEIVLRIKNPNSINLYNLMKERLPIIYQGNHFETNLNEDILIREIRNINYFKF